MAGLQAYVSNSIKLRRGSWPCAENASWAWYVCVSISLEKMVFKFFLFLLMFWSLLNCNIVMIKDFPGFHLCEGCYLVKQNCCGCCALHCRGNWEVDLNGYLCWYDWKIQEVGSHGWRDWRGGQKFNTGEHANNCWWRVLTFSSGVRWTRPPPCLSFFFLFPCHSFFVFCLQLGSLKKKHHNPCPWMYTLLQYRPKSLALLGLPSGWSIQRKQVLMGRVLVELLKVNTISLYAGESLSWDKSQLMYSFTFCGTLLWTKLSRGVLATRLWKLKFYCAVSDCKSLLFQGGISLHQTLGTAVFVNTKP